MSSVAANTQAPRNPSANPLLEAALAHAKRGWRVFPVHSIRNGVCSCKDKGACKDSGKHPRILDNLKAATTDPSQIRRWWTKWPDANIGIATGAESNLVVVDEDPRHGGDESLRALESEIGRLPDTVMVLTGGGGSHRYFLHPGGHVTSHEIYLGLDIKADDGYVVAPQSGHLSGRRYEWELSSHPDDAPLAEIPTALLEILKAPEPSAYPGVEGDEVIKSGRRNRTLFRLACSIRRYAGIEIILPAIRTVNAERCKPPLSDDELVKIAEGVVKRYPIEDLAGSKTESEESPGASGPASPGDATNGREGHSSDFNLTDYGNAERLAALHRSDLRYSHPEKKWYCWDDRRWVPDDTGEVMRRAKATIRKIYAQLETCPDRKIAEGLFKHAIASEREPRLQAMIDLAQSESGIPVLPRDLDNDNLLLNLENGTLDLRMPSARGFRTHRREDLITCLSPIGYDTECRCPRFLEFLRWAMAENEELVAYVRRVIAYCLTGLVTEQALFIFFGLGENGKSTLLNLLLYMLGDYAIQAPPELLVTHRKDSHPTGVADLKGKRLVVSIETEAGSQLAEALVKQLTGGDTIRARRMRQDYFQFEPTHKVILAVNHKPVIKGSDWAIWRRIHLVPFKMTVDPEVKDLQLLEKLKSEAPGVLAWALEGLAEWMDIGGLAPPEEVLAATKNYREEMDVLGGFLEEMCVLGPSYRARASDLYRAYCKWCHDRNDAGVSQTDFGVQLTGRGIAPEKKGGVSWRTGVGLKSPVPEDNQDS